LRICAAANHDIPHFSSCNCNTEEILEEENRSLREQLSAAIGGKTLSFTADQRRRLAAAGKLLTPDERRRCCQIVRRRCCFESDGAEKAGGETIPRSHMQCVAGGQHYMVGKKQHVIESNAECPRRARKEDVHATFV
jgi:hypothetical protein